MVLMIMSQYISNDTCIYVYIYAQSMLMSSDCLKKGNDSRFSNQWKQRLRPALANNKPIINSG